MTSHEYTLTLSSRQARVVVEALEFYQRAATGHWAAVAWTLCEMHVLMQPVDEHVETRDFVTTTLDSLRPRLMNADVQRPNSHYGISGPYTHGTAKLAYEVQCVLRQRIAKSGQSNAWSVWHDGPMSCGTGEAFAKCESRPTEDGPQ